MINLDNLSNTDLRVYGFGQHYNNYTINILINFLIKHAQSIGIRYTDLYQLKQYCLPITYQEDTINFIFEFDQSQNFVFVVYYNKDQTETYLKIELKQSEKPTILMIASDHIERKIKSGVYLMKLSHKLLKLIGSNNCRLDDDSYLIKNISTVQGTQKIKLWLYSLLKHKKSWYAKFGYEPENYSEIIYLVNKLRSIQNKIIIDLILESEYKDIVKYLDSNNTFGEFVDNSSIEHFGIVTNAMMQSVFNKKEYIWYQLMTDLFLANVIQVNNNI